MNGSIAVQCHIVVLLATAALAVGPAMAQSAREAQITRSASQTSSETALEQRLARDWGLSVEDWSRYRRLMQGPLGTYSPNLDPLTALGIEARDDAERHRIAELQVRVEAQRTEKLLSYQRAYDAAFQRAYLNTPRVNPPATQVRTQFSAGRLALFVKDGCSPCDSRARELQAAGTPFDVYMVGSRQDDTRIRQWAARVGILPAKVRDRTITLNHDAGRWLSLGLPGELPALLLETPEGWRRQQ
ncbi:TPA: TIGR03759 family integrating conjugative element protein [Pseudomonas aeruginosa]|uniref:TIGR03759 family integrating conjugative element protein n=1 Tax=Pseudomonas aeruginosa TaxID=287 RepID=UPI001C8E4921|nr:TIGR03759 family integrating conjugative element protein [Pseudomonas aeruginosa]HEJ3532216.1 TIGR03759 family integrating conjugative element protein [Pseudomonas aeruginosa]